MPTFKAQIEVDINPDWFDEKTSQDYSYQEIIEMIEDEIMTAEWAGSTLITFSQERIDG